MSVHFKIGIRTLKKGPKRVSGVCSVKIAKKNCFSVLKTFRVVIGALWSQKEDIHSSRGYYTQYVGFT